MLKECPFCGGKAENYTSEFEGEQVFSVACSKCFATTPGCESEKIAVDIWNKRTDLISENKDGLLSCPCCDGNAEVGKFEDNGKIFYAVVCTKCGLTSQGSDNEHEIISFWNNRK